MNWIGVTALTLEEWRRLAARRDRPLTDEPMQVRHAVEPAVVDAVTLLDRIIEGLMENGE